MCLECTAKEEDERGQGKRSWSLAAEGPKHKSLEFWTLFNRQPQIRNGKRN